MSRILVTGGCGFIGSHVAEALCMAGHQVLVVDDLSGGKSENLPVLYGLQFQYCDLVNAEVIGKICKLFRPEIIHHTASCAREGSSQFQPMWVTRQNVTATVSLLEAAIVSKSLRRFVAYSSMAIYGNQPPPFDETMDLRPVDVYGQGKSWVEGTVRILAGVHDFEWTIIRPRNVFGERQAFDLYRNVVAIFCNRIMRYEPLYIYGDGEQRRSFSYIADSLPCYVKVTDDPVARNQIFNIGGTVPITINQLAEAVIEEFSEYPRPEIVHLPDRPCEVKDAWCTFDKSVRVLGFKEQIGWREGIHRMASWAKMQGPQDWRYDHLPLLNEKAPITWQLPSEAKCVSASSA